jgi:hypothetical protein
VDRLDRGVCWARNESVCVHNMSTSREALAIFERGLSEFATNTGLLVAAEAKKEVGEQAKESVWKRNGGLPAKRHARVELIVACVRMRICQRICRHQLSCGTHS